MLQTLSAYQDRMFEITGRAEQHLLRDGPASSADLDRCRVEMSRLMTSYQLFVHREVFEPLIATGTLAEVQGAKALKVECITLAAEFRDYTQYWGTQDLAARWTEYQPLALAMISRMRNHARGVRRLAPKFLTDKTPINRSAYQDSAAA